MEALSFSGRLKAELCRTKPTGCCRIALCYGLLLFGRSFCKTDISIRTSSRETAELYASLIKLCFGVLTAASVSGGKRTSYTVRVTGEADRNRIVNYYDSDGSDWILNPKFVKRTCCRWAFIRGAFLACGSINDLKRGYHLEFAVKDPTLAFAFSAFLELCGHKPGYSSRPNVAAVYYNNSTEIEEILGGMGALQYCLELMEVKIVRDMRNKLNRKTNFDTANISKTVDAAVLQNEAIAYLESENLLGLLPEELHTAAILRKNNPDASLSALCGLCGENITRSGMNHRLKRIIETAKEAGFKSRAFKSAE